MRSITRSMLMCRRTQTFNRPTRFATRSSVVNWIGRENKENTNTHPNTHANVLSQSHFVLSQLTCRWNACKLLYKRAKLTHMTEWRKSTIYNALQLPQNRLQMRKVTIAWKQQKGCYLLYYCFTRQRAYLSKIAARNRQNTLTQTESEQQIFDQLIT